MRPLLGWAANQEENTYDDLRFVTVGLSPLAAVVMVSGADAGAREICR